MSDEGTGETRGGGKSGRSGFSEPVLRRKRATAISYPRTRVPRAVNGIAAEDWRNGEASGESSESTASDRSMEYTYVTQVPSECLCDLCGELMEEPLQTQCCHKDYCQPCLSPPPNTRQEASNSRKKTLSSGVDCPDCKAPNVKLKLNEELKRLAESLQVKCGYSSAGCVWEGQRSWLKSHMDGCQYASVTCAACGGDMRKRDALPHSNSECPMRSVQCEHCSMEGTHDLITNHHYQECPQYPVTCTLNCGETIPRARLSDHVTNECRTLGLKCPFQPLGCTASPIPVDDMKSHVASCGMLHLVNMFNKFSTDIANLQTEVQKLREENQTLRQEVKSATDAMATTKETMETMRRKSDAVNKTLLTELEYYYSAKHPTELIAVECIKTQLASSLIHLQPGGSPATLRMENYTSHKESGQVWHSPPFYIHSGYKLRLDVHLNGVGAGKGTHMSVYLHLLAGERDEELHWPYLVGDRVLVRLLQQTAYQTASQPSKHSPPSPRTTSTSIGKGSPRLFSRRTNPDFTDSLPPGASLLRQKRRQVDDQRAPPKDNETHLIAVETQPMSIRSYLNRVPAGEKALAGQVISKVDLFCTQSRVKEAVYRDSLVFQCELCSENLSEGSLACQ